MGILGDIFTRGTKYKCEWCGTVHPSEPEECENCGYTAFEETTNPTRQKYDTD